MRKAEQDEFEEHHRKEAFRLWYQQRKDALRSRVSAHDVLRHFGVTLKFSGDREEQICCPFHGDKDPSARVYGEQGTSPSGVYCYVCRKRWDIIALWKEFNNDPEMKYGAVLLGLERAFGIITPEAPERGGTYRPAGPTDEEQAVLDKLEVCEKRLRAAKPHFQLKGFLTLGKLLDNLHYQMLHKLIDVELADRNVHLILDKIVEKTRGD